MNSVETRLDLDTLRNGPEIHVAVDFCRRPAGRDVKAGTFSFPAGLTRQAQQHLRRFCSVTLDARQNRLVYIGLSGAHVNSRGARAGPLPPATPPERRAPRARYPATVAELWLGVGDGTGCAVMRQQRLGARPRKAPVVSAGDVESRESRTPKRVTCVRSCFKIENGPCISQDPFRVTP